ncbi:class I SAM-dependent methyltransferase [Brevundimonas sp. MEB006b]|uniref:class I SAM-dependent methyltransferase n=1 Tax=Brevundimonas sp. MEB006b TaxID=3040283 RepID=UPI00254FB39A|nr:class I SAM-dependent methyltransferase [Brevundimonas sp. MEB006b]
MQIEDALSHVQNACSNIAGGPYGEDHYFHVHRLRFAHTLMRLSYLENIGRMLEIGSDGLFLRLGRYVLSATEVAGTVHHEGEPTAFVGNDYFQFQFYGVDLESTQLPVPDGSFDTVVCGEVIEHMARDPMALLQEINRLLPIGGHCLITTPNISSYRNIDMALQRQVPMNFYKFRKDGSLDRHHIEYTPKLLCEFLETAGFEISICVTENCWSASHDSLQQFVEKNGYSPHDRGDNIFVMCKKIGPVLERYPDIMYV